MNKKNAERIFPFSDKELARLSKENSGIILRKNIYHRVKAPISALPVDSAQFKEAVLRELNKRVLKYNHSLDDVILRFMNVKVLPLVEANMCPRLNVRCVADMFVFKPEFGKVMNAVVNKISKNHIGCIMYDLFNVSIVKPNDVPYSQWSGRDLNIGDNVTFKVQKVDIAEIIPYIVGEFMDENYDSGSCVEIDERDSVISVDRNSCITSDEIYSDLDDVLETIHDPKTKKRKRCDSVKEENSPKRKKLK